jgi:hypothetical protein
VPPWKTRGREKERIMQGQKVQEYSVETGPNGLPVARLGQVHNLVTFIEGGRAKRHYLDGRWVDDGGNELPETDITDEMRAKVAAIPFKPNAAHQEQVLIHCEFCPETLPSGDYATHLAKHVRAGTAPVVEHSDTLAKSDAPVRLRPDDLPPGNYVTDDDGFVVLNADGSPRKRAGRPPKEDKE